jgi:hypothetical protein
VPWALVAYQTAFVGAWSVPRMMDHLEYYVRIINKHLVPLAAMAVSGILLRWWPRPADPAERLPWSERWLLIVVVGAQLLFLLIPDQRHMRYMIPLLPILLIGEAWWLAAWLKASRLFGWALVGLALFTNVLHSPHVRIPLADFLGELTHAYVGPMEGIVGYLQANGRTGQTVKIPYDDRTLMFYTDLTVEPPSKFLEPSDPDWLVIRRDWIPGGFFTSEQFRRIEAGYERIELDAPDIQWQNREDPGSHHFRTVQGVPRIVLYRKAGS